MTYFPDHVHTHCGDFASEYFERLNAATRSVDGEAMDAAAELLLKTTLEGGHIFSCGNGGSAAIANHLVCDCLKGIRTDTALRPKVFSLSTTVELITAIANDIGADEIFAFQLSSVAKEGDVLIAISSSGNSPNIIRVLKVAREIGLRTIVMTGFTGGQARSLADVSLHVDCHNYGIVEDTHQALMHILSQYVRQGNMTHPELLGSLKF